jgi:hypothetical protein
MDRVRWRAAKVMPTKIVPGRDEPLHLTPDIRIDVRSTGASVEGPLGRCVIRSEGLFELLALFERPTSLARALAAVPVRGVADWAERSATLLELVRVGALAAEGAQQVRPQGFADPAIHARMLGDHERMTAYLRAIRTSVRPDDVVLDLGTGTGVLAVAAAQAGARHVFAIEETAIADVAEEVFRVNGVSDRVTLVRGHSTRVELPERATLLVTETLGNDPLGEGMLVYIDDAQRRLLSSDARFVPARVRIVVQLVDVPEGRVAPLDEARVRAWHTRYGIDLSPLHARHWGADVRVSHDADDGTCSVPVVVEEIEMASATRTADTTIALSATRATRNLGIALGYDIVLSEDEELSIGPHGHVASHWRWQVFAKLSPRACAREDRVEVRFTRSRTGCRLALG